MNLRHLTTTFINAIKLKPKYLLKNYSFYKNPENSFFLNPDYSFKTNIDFFEIQNIHSEKLFIFFKIPNIHSNQIFIFLKEAVSARANLNFPGVLEL